MIEIIILSDFRLSADVANNNKLGLSVVCKTNGQKMHKRIVKKKQDPYLQTKVK